MAGGEALAGTTPRQGSPSTGTAPSEGAASSGDTAALERAATPAAAVTAARQTARGAPAVTLAAILAEDAQTPIGPTPLDEGPGDRTPNHRSAGGEPSLPGRDRPSLPADIGTVVTRRETHFAPVRQRDPAAAGHAGATSQPPSVAPALPQHLGLAPLPSGAALPPAQSSTAPPAARPEASIILGQIVQAIVARGDGAAAGAPEPSAAAPTSQAAQPVTIAAAAGPVRIVEIQLQPAALGALTVTMRLSPAGLKVTVSASSRETAQLLDENRKELAELIRGVGYDGADVTVEQAAAANADAGGSGPGAGGNPPSERRRPVDPPRLQGFATPGDTRLHRSIVV